MRDFPQWLEDAILKCLEKEPTNRFRNGKELYDFIISHCHNAGYVLTSTTQKQNDENLKAKCAKLERELKQARLLINNLEAELQEEREKNKQRFCRKCGNPLRPEAIFCNKCGTKIS